MLLTWRKKFSRDVKCLLQALLTVAFVVSTVTVTRDVSAMEADQALKLLQAFGSSVKDPAFVGRMQVDARGGWVTRARGGTFRYDAVNKKLIFSSFIANGVVTFAKYPERWDKLDRHARRMPKVMGDGYFEIIKEGPFLDHKTFPLLMLTKDFKDGSIKPEQFVMEAQWLLYGAAFWGGGPSPYGFSGVQTEPEEVLIKVAEKIQRERPQRPW